MEKESKSAQVTIFIIVGIIIVAAVLVFFLWIKPTYFPSDSVKPGFEGCVEKAVEDAVEDIGVKGGFVNPEFYYLSGGEKVPYLCYTNLYYKPCINQKPFLKQHFEENLYKSIRAKVDSCFESSLNDLRSQGYEVVGEKGDLSIEIVPGKIAVVYDAPVVIQRSSTQKFTKFALDVNSEIYNMLMIATSIVQYETAFGDSDVDSLMLYYPDLIVRKMKMSEGTTIYTLEDKQTKTKFQFASRSFAWPAGYGLSEGYLHG